MTDSTAPAAYGLARLGNGAAVHITDGAGILCNRWGTVNGVWKAPRPVPGDWTEATCKRCHRIRQDAARPAWANAAENLPAAREAGYDV